MCVHSYPCLLVRRWECVPDPGLRVPLCLRRPHPPPTPVPVPSPSFPLPAGSYPGPWVSTQASTGVCVSRFLTAPVESAAPVWGLRLQGQWSHVDGSIPRAGGTRRRKGTPGAPGISARGGGTGGRVLTRRRPLLTRGSGQGRGRAGAWTDSGSARAGGRVLPRLRASPSGPGPDLRRSAGLCGPGQGYRRPPSAPDAAGGLFRASGRRTVTRRRGRGRLAPLGPLPARALSGVGGSFRLWREGGPGSGGSGPLGAEGRALGDVGAEADGPAGGRRGGDGSGPLRCGDGDGPAPWGCRGGGGSGALGVEGWRRTGPHGGGDAETRRGPGREETEGGVVVTARVSRGVLNEKEDPSRNLRPPSPATTVGGGGTSDTSGRGPTELGAGRDPHG